MRRPNEDTLRHQGLRNKLIDQLRVKGIQDEQVLAAMSRVPRHFFMDAGFDELAYLDRSFPIEADQTISHPYTVAYQTQLLGVKKHEKVLEQAVPISRPYWPNWEFVYTRLSVSESSMIKCKHSVG